MRILNIRGCDIEHLGYLTYPTASLMPVKRGVRHQGVLSPLGVTYSPLLVALVKCFSKALKFKVLSQWHA